MFSKNSSQSDELAMHEALYSCGCESVSVALGTNKHALFYHADNCTDKDWLYHRILSESSFEIAITAIHKARIGEGLKLMSPLSLLVGDPAGTLSSATSIGSAISDVARLSSNGFVFVNKLLERVKPLIRKKRDELESHWTGYKNLNPLSFVVREKDWFDVSMAAALTPIDRLVNNLAGIETGVRVLKTRNGELTIKFEERKLHGRNRYQPLTENEMQRLFSEERKTLLQNIF